MSILSVLKKPSRIGILVGLFGAGLAWGFAQLPPMRGLEEWLHDGGFSLRGTRLFSRAKVVLIGLDDRSLNDLREPLVHTSPQIAKVVAYVKEQGATAIGIDVMIPDNLAGLPELNEGGRGDATKLGAAILEAGNVVLPEFKLDDGWLEPLPQWRLKAFLHPGPTDSGFVNNTEDDDHFVRRQQLLIPDGDTARMHFSLALFVKGQEIKKVDWDDVNQRLLLNGETIPLDDEQKFRINFVGPPGTFPVMPLSDVLAAARDGKKTPELSGSIVIIGVTARAGQDYHATPFANNFARSFYSTSSGLMSGPEVHANIIATLHDRAYLVAPHWLVSLGILLVAGGILGRWFAKLNLAWGLVLAFAFHFAWKYLAYAALISFYWRLELVSMLLMGMLVYLVTFIQRWWTTRRALGVVQGEFVARFLEEDPGQLDHSGQECIATILFADIRDFTAYSEKHAAHEVVRLLNTYFSALVPIVEAHGGTLSTYMGDGMMVIFGAPTHRPDDAVQAVRAAVAMTKRVRELKATWAELDFPDLRMGIGIHTGRVVAGMTGSPKRRVYSAIGDTVNTASRIESQTKELGVEILISPDTLRDLPAKDRAALGCAPVEKPAKLKGKDQPILLHTISVTEDRIQSQCAQTGPL
jgi:adenylate cyclase